MSLVGSELAEQFGGGLVEDVEAGAERVAGDRLPVPLLVVSGGAAGCREEGLVLLVLLVPRRDGRPGAGRSLVSPSWPGTAATTRPQAFGWAWATLAPGSGRRRPRARWRGQDSRRVVMPRRLSRRRRSRAAITQVRSRWTSRLPMT